MCVFVLPSHVNGSPALGFNAVHAAGPKRSRGNIIQVMPHHTRAAWTRAVDLGGGVEQALVGLLLAPESCSNSGGQVDVSFFRLIYLGLVGEQDLGL